MKSVLKALGWFVLAIIIMLGALMFLGTIWIAWPVLVVVLVLGLPFVIIGVIAGKSDKKDK